MSLIYIFKVIFDKRIKDEEDVEKELGLPVLGSIQNLIKDGCYLCQKENTTTTLFVYENQNQQLVKSFGVYVQTSCFQKQMAK